MFGWDGRENKEFKQVTTCLVLILGHLSSHVKDEM